VAARKMGSRKRAFVFLIRFESITSGQILLTKYPEARGGLTLPQSDGNFRNTTKSVN
jgi:hypothetical protein